MGGRGGLYRRIRLKDGHSKYIRKDQDEDSPIPDNKSPGRELTEEELIHSDGTIPIRDPETLMKFFDAHASGSESDKSAIQNMFAQWKAESVDDRQENNDMSRFFNYIGWADRTPIVFDDASYKRLYKNSGSPQQLYHSDTSLMSLSGEEMAAQFMGRATDENGVVYRHYVAGGAMGAGTYFADSAGESAKYGESQYRGFLKPGAKAVDFHELQRDLKSYFASNPAFAKAFGTLTTKYGGWRADKHYQDEAIAVFAAMRGYNVITYSGVGYYTVLDRSAMVVSDRVVTTAKPSMRDW